MLGQRFDASMGSSGSYIVYVSAAEGGKVDRHVDAHTAFKREIHALMEGGWACVEGHVAWMLSAL